MKRLIKFLTPASGTATFAVLVSGLITGLIIQMRWFYFHGGISLWQIKYSGWGGELIIPRLILSPAFVAVLFLTLYITVARWLLTKQDKSGADALGKIFLVFSLLLFWRIFIFKYWFIYSLTSIFAILVIIGVPYFRDRIKGLLKSLYYFLVWLYSNIVFNRLTHFFKQRPFLTSVIVALLSIWWLFENHFGYVILDTGSISWLMSYDWAQHFLGWHFFRNAPWEFPIGTISDFYYPVGTSIGYTDSIPLMALSFKLFNSWLPPVFQYIGWWFLLCFVLQALFSALLFREFKVSLWARIAGVLLLTFSPVLLGRYPHPALCAHWLIIGSFWLWFYSGNTNKRKKVMFLQILLLFLSSLIHPYLSIIVIIYTIALVWKLYGGFNFGRFTVFASITAILALMVLTIWYLLGYIGVSSSYELAAWGFGWFSANLNTFFNSAETSTYLYALPQYSEGQAFEGYAYLGLGVICLLFIIIFYYLLSFFDNKITSIISNQTLKKNALLLAVTLGLAVFALSNIITLGSKVLFIIPIDDIIQEYLSPFRSSGRFIWPMHYLILIGIIVYLGRGKFFSLRTSSIVLTACIIIQFYDIKPLTRKFYLTDKVYEANTGINMEKWKQLYEGADKILFYPPFDRHYKGEDDYIPFAYLAGSMGKKINIGYLARADQGKIKSAAEDFNSMIKFGSIDSKTLIVTTTDHLSAFYPLIMQRKIGFVGIDGYYVGAVEGNKSFTKDWYPVIEEAEDFVIRNTDRIIFFAVKDEASEQLPQGFKEYMTSIGSGVKNLGFRGAWTGIIYKGKLLYEQISNTGGPAEIQINQGDVFNGISFNKSILLHSSGNETGNKASIIIGDTDFSRKMRGLNMVTADDSLNVINTVNIDTYYGAPGFHFIFY